MAFYDEERILEDADAVSVAEYLGLEIRRAGSRHQIYCPGHLERLGKPDTRMGSCYLTAKGYHCYACDKTVNLPNMVMEVENCSYKEALGIIADSLGGRDLYTISGKREFEENEKILSESDLNLIGLTSTISFDIVQNCCSSKEEVLEQNAKNQESEDDEIRRMSLSPKADPNLEPGIPLYLAVHHQTVSLKSFFQETPEDYYYMVRNKAKETMEKYKSWITALETDGDEKFEALKAVLGYINVECDDSTIFDFKQIFTDFYARAKEIYLSITPQMAGEVEEEVQEVPKPKVRLDLFENL